MNARTIVSALIAVVVLAVAGYWYVMPRDAAGKICSKAKYPIQLQGRTNAAGEIGAYIETRADVKSAEEAIASRTVIYDRDGVEIASTDGSDTPEKVGAFASVLADVSAKYPNADDVDCAPEAN